MIDLKPFCAKEDEARLSLQSPWSRGEYTYATNGHIMVRVARRDDVPENEKAPAGEKIFDAAKSAGWLPVPACELPPDIQCELCHGTGEHECSCGHLHECVDCKGACMVDAAGQFEQAARELRRLEGSFTTGLVMTKGLDKP